jgi:hypothetical protein
MNPQKNYSDQQNNPVPQPEQPPYMPPAAPPTFPQTEVQPTAITAAPVAAVAPANSTEPVPLTPLSPVLPVESKRSKKPQLIIGVIIAILLVIAVTGAVAYGVINSSPDKILTDAAINTLKAEALTAKGNIVYEDEKSDGSVTISFASKSINKKLEGSLDVEMQLKYSGFETSVRGSGVFDKDGYGYVKIDDTPKLVDDFGDYLSTSLGAGADPTNMEQYLQPLRNFADKIDGQWIKIDKKYFDNFIKDFDKTRECSQKAYDEFAVSPVWQKQVADVYAANKFVTITDVGGKYKADNAQNYIYDLAFDEKKQTSFEKALNSDTELGRVLAKCTEKPTIDTDVSGMSAQDSATVWVDRGARSFTRFKLTANEGSSKIILDTKLDTKTPVKIDAPKSTLTSDELQQDISNVLIALFGGYGSVSSPTLEGDSLIQ